QPQLSQHLADLPDEFARQEGRACSCATAVTSISNRASWRPSFTWAAWSRLNKTFPRTWSTGSELNRRAYSRASSAARLSPWSAPLGPAVPTTANLPHPPVVGRPWYPRPSPQEIGHPPVSRPGD